MLIRAYVVDDEKLAVQRLTRLLTDSGRVAVAGSATDPHDALEALRDADLDVVFLDIQMPEMTGIEVARSLAANPELKCHVVFVTAFDQYAVEAFEANAVDYVLKPYSDARLQAAVDRLKGRLEAKPAPAPQDLNALIATIAAKFNPQHEPLKWIKASVGQTLRLIPIEDVLFFQAGDKYTLVATRELDALIRTPIKEIIDGIDGEKYWQIHRSTIVNASAIESVSRDFRGQASVKVKGRKESLPVSRPFSHLFKQM